MVFPIILLAVLRLTKAENSLYLVSLYYSLVHALTAFHWFHLNFIFTQLTTQFEELQ